MARPTPTAFADLVRDHADAVHRSALRICRDAAAADDVTQDVFVRVLQGKVPLPGEAGPRAALCWLASRLALNHLRAARRRLTHEDHAAMTRTANQPSPADDATQQERQRALLAAVAGLPDELRLPLLLRHQDGLTLRQVGSALALPQSTAHDRVQQALARLRQVLGAAFAVAPVQVADLVAAEPAPAAPAELHARLLALPGTVAGGTAALGKLAAAALVLTGGLVATFALSGAAERSPDDATAAAAAAAAAAMPALPMDPEPATARTATATPAVPASTSTQDPAPAPTHVVFTGTVRDAAAWPVQEARVVAVAAGGLKPFELARTITDGGGAFRLEVPLAGEPVPARRIRIRVLEQQQLLLETGEFDLHREAAQDSLVLTLPPEAGVASDRCRVLLSVTGPDGAPLHGVPVALHELGEPGQPRPRPGQTRPESEAATAADGSATLATRRPGRQLLLVDPRRQGLRAHLQEVVLDRPGEHRLAVQCRPGLELRGRIASTDGTPVEWANVWLEEPETGLYHQTKLGADGSIAFRGLGEGPFTLRVDAYPWSPVARAGVRPGGDPVQVRLKRGDDPRDLGDHMAEIHGRVVDAATGAEVAYAPDSFEVRPLLGGDSTLLLDRVEPPPPVQRMLDTTPRSTFHAPGLAAGRWAVCVRADGYAPAVVEVALAEGEIVGDLRVPLHRGATVHGRLVDAAGAGIAGARVLLLGVGSRADANLQAWDQAVQQQGRRHGSPSLVASVGRTDATGTFELRDVTPDCDLRVVGLAQGQAPAVSKVLRLRSGEQRSGLVLHAAGR